MAGGLPPVAGENKYFVDLALHLRVSTSRQQQEKLPRGYLNKEASGNKHTERQGKLVLLLLLKTQR